MRACRFLLLLGLLLLAACTGRSVVGGPTGAPAQDAAIDVDSDLFALPTFDIPPGDRAATVDVTLDRGDVELSCTLDRDCLRGQRCLQGVCSEDVCLASENACGNDRCQMQCVPLRDPCAEVHCEAGQTCFAGRCIAGCFPSPCAGVQCPAGHFCDDRSGVCSRITPCPARCHDGFTCHVACLPRSPCDSVMCPSDQTCANGVCVANPCATLSCPSGSLCIDGRCVDTCACDTPCNRSPRDRCLIGHCVCERTCTPTTPCGSDDGCGGHCLGPCAQPNATCDPVLFACRCVPRCDSDTSCGHDDGCGGRCNEGCAAGEECDATLGRCVCVPRCPPPESFAGIFCGVPIHNLCPDGPLCGSGTMCPAGQVCDPHLFRCVCVGADCPMSDAMTPDEMDATVVTCPVGLSSCSGQCVDTRTDSNHCGDCNGHCPQGTSCADGLCVCPASLTLCGARCVDTRTENGNCGTCGTVCAARTACQGGVCQCATACTVDLNSVPCGTVVPSPCPGGSSCGYGRACPDGQGCDTRTRACVCVPRCPAGVRCGVSDGCGGQCIGACGTGESCTQDSADPRRFFCSAAGCAAGCRCDEVCSMNHCVQITCGAGDRPCPCQCCPFGQMCVGGNTCLPIPP